MMPPKLFKLSKGVKILFILFATLGMLISQNPKKNSQDKNDKTFYKADNIVIKQKQKIIILTGKAFIRRGKQGLSADKIIWDQQKDEAEAFDNVKFLNQEQGVVYRGGYLKFFLGEDRVFASKKPHIENKKQNTTIYAKTFTAFTTSNVIKANENAIIYMNQGKTNEIIARGDRADYYEEVNDLHLFGNSEIQTPDKLLEGEYIVLDQSNQILTLREKVLISPLPKEKRKGSKKKNQSPDKPADDSENYLLSCKVAVFKMISSDLDCFENTKIQHRTENRWITGDKLVYSQSNQVATLFGNVHYFEGKESNSYHSFSDWLQLQETNSLIIQSNQVFAYDQSLDETTNQSLNCDLLFYYFNDQEDLKPHGNHDLIECFGEAKLRNINDQSEINSSYITYRTDLEFGKAFNQPSFVNYGSNNHLFVYSKEMEIHQKNKNVLFLDEVNIVSKPAVITKTSPATNSTINCVTAIYQYGTTDPNPSPNFETTFSCYTNVNINFPNQNANLKGDLLTYYFDENYSRLDGDVSFDQIKNPSNRIEGTSLYAINQHDDNTFNLHQNVVVFEFETVDGIEQKTSRMTTDYLKYVYNNSNTIEAFTNVEYYKYDDQSHLYSDYFIYDSDRQYGYAIGSPRVKQMSTNADEPETLYYADRIELHDYDKKVKLYDNIYLYQVESNPNSLVQTPPPRNSQSLTHLNFLNCSKGVYNYFENPFFECLENFHMKDHQEGTDIYSDYVLHDLTKNYTYLKENPYIERRKLTNFYKIYSETMEYDRDKKQIHYKDDVLMVEFNQDLTTNSYMQCDYSLYDFNTNTHQMECYSNVLLASIADNITLTSEYVRYLPDNKYSYASIDPYLVKNESNEITSIKADIMERFEDEAIMYAKGSVLIDNGKDKARSDWAIYNMKIEKIELYGNPQVIDQNGSIFNSEEITFDVLGNTMQLGSSVSGNFLFDEPNDPNSSGNLIDLNGQ